MRGAANVGIATGDPNVVAGTMASVGARDTAMEAGDTVTKLATVITARRHCDTDAQVRGVDSAAECSEADALWRVPLDSTEMTSAEYDPDTEKFMAAGKHASKRCRGSWWRCKA